MRRSGFWNFSVVAYSTTSRAGRSVRLQTSARDEVTSPAATPVASQGERILIE
jgi:hypothetical protein